MQNEDEPIVVLYGKYVPDLWKKTTMVEYLYRTPFAFLAWGWLASSPGVHLQLSRILCTNIDYVVDTLSRVPYKDHVMHITGKNWDMTGRNERQRETI